MKQALTIGTATAEAGFQARGMIPVGTFSTGTTVSIPVIVIHGEQDGPTIWVNACVHGNELNGVIAAQRLAADLQPTALRGAVIITPISNPIAFREKSRLSALDGDFGAGAANMGEAFPGTPYGTMTSQLAYALLQEIKQHADAVVDLHSWGFGQDSKPYGVVKIYEDEEISRQNLEMATAFGMPLICKLDMRQTLDEPSPVDRQMDVLCAKAGIPGFMAEVGHSTWVEEDYVTFIYEGTKNVLRYFGVLDEPVIEHPQPVVLGSRQVIRCKKDGLALAQVKPHQHVKQGEILSKIHNAYGDVVEVIKAQYDMFTVSLPYQPNVNGGERVAFVGIVEEQ